MRKLAVLILVFLVLSAQAYAGAEFPIPIIFRPVDNPNILAFAVSELRGEIVTKSEAEWVAAVKDHALYAEIDIDDDGIPELFLQFNWLCGTVGCDTSIYKRTDQVGKGTVLLGKAKRYKEICFETMTGNDPQTYLLEKKENGYHLIDTENGAIIHWDSIDKFGNPECWLDEVPGR